MGYGTYAFCVYGVIPEGPFFNRFLSLFDPVQKILLQVSEEDEWNAPDWPETVAKEVFRLYPDLLEELQEQYSAPADTCMLWTGGPDFRIGRCETDVELWLLGYSYRDLPLQKVMPEAFRLQATWYTWVEGG